VLPPGTSHSRNFVVKSVTSRVSQRNALLQNSNVISWWMFCSGLFFECVGFTHSVSLSTLAVFILQAKRSFAHELTQKEFISIRPVQGFNPNRRPCPRFEPEWLITSGSYKLVAVEFIVLARTFLQMFQISSTHGLLK
jgi:hypothetical protein